MPASTSAWTSLPQPDPAPSTPATSANVPELFRNTFSPSQPIDTAALDINMADLGLVNLDLAFTDLFGRCPICNDVYVFRPSDKLVQMLKELETAPSSTLRSTYCKQHADEMDVFLQTPEATKWPQTLNYAGLHLRLLAHVDAFTDLVREVEGSEFFESAMERINTDDLFVPQHG